MFVSSGVGTDAPPSHLYTINPETGEIATDIGTIIEEGTGLEPAITDLAVTPGGLLFGCSYTTLYLIDQQTAQAQVVATLGVQGVNALAFNKTNGFLYGATLYGELLNINPNNGQAVVLAQLSSGYVASGDLVFSPDNTLYGTLKQPGQTADDVIAIIGLDGTVQPLTDTPSGARHIFGISYFNDQLYGVTASPDPALWAIDLTTGQVAFITDLPFSAFGSN